MHSMGVASPDHISKSDDSISKFKRNLRELLPDLHSEKDSTTTE